MKQEKTFRECKLSWLERIFGLDQVKQHPALDSWLSEQVTMTAYEKENLMHLQEVLDFNVRDWKINEKMKKEYIEDQNFKGENYSIQPLNKGEYNNCAFINCTFLNADLKDIQFIECTFDNCDLSNAQLKNAAFRDVNFTNCKLLGLQFDDCNNFLMAFNFDNCLLNYASFYKLKLKNTRFNQCKLEDVSFEKTDLTNAIFSHCALNKALFDNTQLEGADFRTAFNLSINPEINSLKKAKFSTQNIAGLLDKYKIIIE